MFEMQYITSRVHRFLHRFFYLRHDYDDEYSIWNFCPTTIWREFTAMLQSSCFCRTALFPMVYWLVVFISLYGAVINCYEVLQMWRDPCGKFTVWRQRHFYVMDQMVLRKVRLLSSSIYQVAWFMLIYGIVMVSPNSMAPWILVTSAVLSVEVFIWFFEVITGILAINPQTLLSLFLHVYFLGMVCCVKSVFEVALAEQAEYSLRII
ncbi:uncharacterized protein LOC108025650 [Drosophila biarmipes]|uniref:uncharacterized protein LOC108025650 n=1 Tax=Drosophila biarmipes TaxID=125945 RepID=UPI0007E6B4CA|nr:uncharacterized protein LOC108025650 [Drosophila biarmipes]